MNQTYRQIYDGLQIEINKTDEQIKVLNNTKYELAEKMAALIEAVILEEQMFSKGVWELEPQHYSAGHFTLTCLSGSSEMKELSKIAETNWHCRCRLGGVELRFDDGRISLSFSPDSPILVLDFVIKHGIRINTKKITEEIEDAEKKLKELQDIVKAFSK